MTSSAQFCEPRTCDSSGATEKMVRIFQALGSEARLCIVQELSLSAEMCVCDLVGCCGLGWSTVSHHLSILREAGIVVDEKRGKQVFYRLALPCVTDFLRCLGEPDCRSTGQTFTADHALSQNKL